ncbi:hypothetical protein AUK22_10695 [bacterium CG2_30_54_10]|nr:MAG: hypothetical protein AUK22_10695 [bacterium CG2_30_54_10]
MQNEIRESPIGSLALSTYVKLSRATETVSTNIHRHLLESGLTISQFGVLEALFHGGPQTMCDLGRKILRSTANLTTVVDNLEKLDLAHRQRPEEDRRQFIVHLTDKGRELISRLFPLHAAIITEEMGFLGPEELEELSRICRKLGKKEDPDAAPDPGHRPEDR